MLCTGEAVGVCTSVFGTQQGEYIDYFLFSQFSRKSVEKQSMTFLLQGVSTSLTSTPDIGFKKKKKGKRKIKATENVKWGALT